jgi:hypothetical protein
MKTQVRAGAVLLAGVLAGSVYGITLTLPQQQQQDSSGQQNQDNKKKKGNSPNGNANNAPANQNASQNPSSPAPINAPQSNPPQSNNPPGGDKPTPLFGGTIGLKSSRQTKDSATLGFNGVDPNGQVQKAMLTAAATPVDAMKAQQVGQIAVPPADLAQFLQDGGLNPDAAPQKP